MVSIDLYECSNEHTNLPNESNYSKKTVLMFTKSIKSTFALNFYHSLSCYLFNVFLIDQFQIYNLQI